MNEDKIKNELLKKKKKASKFKQKIEKSLSWTDLVEVRNNGLILRKGKREEVVKGIKIIPHNLFLMEASIQVDRVSQYRQAINSLNFFVYHAMVYNPIDVKKTSTRLELMASESELTPARIALAKESLNKLNLFTQNYQELEFFLMIKGKNDKRFAKQFSDLKRVIKNAGFQIAELDNVDFENYLSNVFENDLINDFYFAKGEFEILNEEYHFDEKLENDLLLFESDEIYQLMDNQFQLVAEFTNKDDLFALGGLGLHKNEPYLLVSCSEESPMTKRIHFTLKSTDEGLVILPNE